MNDENTPQPQPWIDPALEARIVACVLGETSAFENAELERLLAENPELALFKRRIEAAHALAGAASRPDNPKIQLSPERRKKLLQTIGVPPVTASPKIRVAGLPQASWWSSPFLIRAAACLIMTTLALVIFSSVTVFRSSAPLPEFAGSSGDTGFVQTQGFTVNHNPDQTAQLQTARENLRALVTFELNETNSALLQSPASPSVIAQNNIQTITSVPMPVLDPVGQPADMPHAKADSLAVASAKKEFALPTEESMTMAKLKNMAPFTASERETAERPIPTTGRDGTPLPAVTKEGSLTAGNLADEVAVSANAVDALIANAYAHSGVKNERTFYDNDGRAQVLEKHAPYGTRTDGAAPATADAIDQPYFAMKDGKMVQVEGFINYGSLITVPRSKTAAEAPSQPVDLMNTPVVTTRSGQHASAQVVREFKYPTEFHPPAAKDKNDPPNVARIKKLLEEAGDFQETGRFDLAFKRYEQTLEEDPSNIAARKGMEKVKATRAKYADAAYNEARSRMLFSIDNGWNLPIRRFDVGSATIIEEPGTQAAAIKRKLNEIVIPKVDFQDVTVGEALAALKQRAAELDPSADEPTDKGVNIVLNLPEEASENQARISLGLSDIPLGAAIDYVAKAANLKLKIEPYAVSVVPQSTFTEELITKEYKVPPGFLPATPPTVPPLPLSAGANSSASLPAIAARSGAREHLESLGISFPPGATAYYIASADKLIVKNAAPNLELVDTLLESPQAPSAPSAFPAEIPTAEQPASTFSLHVSDVSFQLAKDALARGARPDPTRIRPEEFYNAFDYNDPAPGPGEPVACRIEQSAHPFLQQRNLVRIAVKVAATGRDAGQPLRLTILLDTSGSMDREDRALSVRQALQTLATLLGPGDRVTLIGFARTPRLLAEAVPGDQAAKLMEAADRTPSEGGTNLEEALALASEMALKHKLPTAQNRIVLLTDGAANLGNADPGRLAKQIETTRQQGISFDACGVGANGLNDEVLETLTRKGDGRYYLLNKPGDADAGFAKQLAGAFRPAAENVKVQVVFHPSRVARYRLIGFEEHLLKREDFRNDKVQAAELSAEEAGVALYQIEPLPEGDGELGEVFVRFRDPASGQMVERSWTMPYEPRVRPFDQASPSLQLAAASALLAEKLQSKAPIDLETLKPVLTSLRSHYPHQTRVRELLRMFEQARP